jgi:hypothetical protein
MSRLAQPGTVVAGDFFISRGQVEQSVRNAIRGADTPVSISVYGQPRIGKTSLVLYIAEEWRREGSLQRNDDNEVERVVVFLDCGRFRGDSESALVGPSLLAALVEELIQELRTRPEFEFGGGFMDFLTTFRNAVQGGSAAQVELHARRLIEEITEGGTRASLLIVLDEGDELQGRFDSALGSLPDWMSGRHGVPLPFVMISRRDCSQIEDQDNQAPGSGWCRSFSRNISVGMFSEESRRAMIKVALEQLDRRATRWARMGSSSEEKVARIEEELNRSCGKHPYLVNHFLDAFVAEDGGEFDDRIRLGLERVRQEEQVLFDRLVRRFGADELLPDLLTALFVPGATISPRKRRLISQAYELASYDEEQSRLVAMSPDFGSYLRHELRSELVSAAPAYDMFLERLFDLVRTLAGENLSACPPALRNDIERDYLSEALRQQEMFFEPRDWCSVMLVTEAVSALRELLKARMLPSSDWFHDQLLPELEAVATDVINAVREVPLGAVLDRLARPGSDLETVEKIRSRRVRIDEARMYGAIAIMNEALENLAIFEREHGSLG